MTQQRFTVELAQIAPRLGNLEANLDIHLAAIAQAKSNGVDLLLFPELSLAGYQVKDLVAHIALRPTLEDAHFARLLAASEGIDVVFGFVEADARWRYANAAAYLSDG